MPDKNKYQVRFKVHCDFTTEVEAYDAEEAEDIARIAYEEANLGDFEFLDEEYVDVVRI